MSLTKTCSINRQGEDLGAFTPEQTQALIGVLWTVFVVWLIVAVVRDGLGGGSAAARGAITATGAATVAAVVAVATNQRDPDRLPPRA